MNREMLLLNVYKSLAKLLVLLFTSHLPLGAENSLQAKSSTDPSDPQQSSVELGERTNSRQFEGDDRTPQNNSPFELLRGLVREALHFNPSIQAARKIWASSTKKPSQVASLPNPELTFGSMSTTNPLPYSTIGGGPVSWASFMFTQSIPWPGKLTLKKDIAKTEAAQKAKGYESVALDVIRQTKEAFFELYYLDRAHTALQRYSGLLEQFSRIAEANYTLGQGIQQNVLQSQVEISLIVEQLELVSRKRESAQARINSLLNRPPDGVLPPIDPIENVSFELPFSIEQLYLKAREQNPEIQSDRLEIQKASLRLDLARKELRPSFTTSVAYFLRGGPFDNMYEYRVGIKIPLYFWRKERLGVEENFEELERSRHSYQSNLQEITFRIKDAYLGVRTSQRLIELYRTGIIPQATASLDSALSSYQVGSINFLTLINSALTLVNCELEYQEQTRDHFQSLAKLEQLLGFVLVG